jgi:hypothetical protein
MESMAADFSGSFHRGKIWIHSFAHRGTRGKRMGLVAFRDQMKET